MTSQTKCIPDYSAKKRPFYSLTLFNNTLLLLSKLSDIRAKSTAIDYSGLIRSIEIGRVAPLRIVVRAAAFIRW